MKSICQSTNTVAGTLVVLLLSGYVGSMMKGTNKTNPAEHILSLILGAAIATPFVFLTSDSWVGFPMQLVVAVIILLLDWISFHEDKTRFSEEEKCIFGNCRRNATITGHMAHWADVMGLWFLFYSNVKSVTLSFVLMTVAFLVYGCMGSLVIESMTGDGSESDLRELKTDEEKCRRARIMSDSWRGGVQDLITVLGVMAMWQVLFPYWKRDTSPFLYAPRDMAREMWSEGRGSNRLLVVAQICLICANTFVPTYLNYVVTAAQHGQIPPSTAFRTVSTTHRTTTRTRESQIAMCPIFFRR